MDPDEAKELIAEGLPSGSMERRDGKLASMEMFQNYAEGLAAR